MVSDSGRAAKTRLALQKLTWRLLVAQRRLASVARMKQSKGALGAGGGLWILVAALCFGGCDYPTSFQGSAKFPGGARGCWDRCAREGTEMASFVYVGEYSTACACRPLQAVGQPLAVRDDEGAVVAATAGVELERRRAAERQRASTVAPPPIMPH